MKKWLNIFSVVLSITLTSLILVFISVPSIRSQIMETAGLAVAQTPTYWNNVKDAAQGDNLTNGILVSAPYLFDGTNWDRPLKTNHGDNVTTSYGQNVAAFMYGFDGTNFDRLRVDSAGNLIVILPMSSTFTHGQVTVGTSATLIKSANTSRRSIIITNQGPSELFIGGSSVTTTNGYRLFPGDNITIDRTTAAIYGIVISGTATAGFIEQ